jgi:hypothetical protein
MPELSHNAQTLLLIMCANGGEMSKDDADRELMRVLALSPDEYATWRTNIMPLVKLHADRVIRNKE